MRTTGNSRMRHSLTACFSTTNTAMTACKFAGWRRQTFFSRRVPNGFGAPNTPRPARPTAARGPTPASSISVPTSASPQAGSEGFLYALTRGRTACRRGSVTFRGNSFSGRDDLGIASFVFKYAPNGKLRAAKLTLTGEYFYDVTNGTYEILGPGASSAIDLKRNGWYAQAAIQFRPRWTFGARLSQLNGDDVPGVLVGSLLDPDGHKPTAVTGLLEFDTSEFGRFRLQYTRDESSRATNDEILFQYTVIYGPHPGPTAY